MKSTLESKENDHTTEEIKAEIIHTCVQAWRLLYSIYHGKCLAWSLANFYGGAADKNPPTCFVSNSPLCTVCMQSADICQWSINIQAFLVVLLKAVKEVYDVGLHNITKTLLLSILLRTNEEYVRKFDLLQDIINNEDTCWGSGVYLGDTAVSRQT